MAHSILIIGESGSGKSTSLFPNDEIGIIGLDPKETFIINTSKKELPFKGWKSKYKIFENQKETPTANILFSDDSKTILNCIKYINQSRPEIKNLVIEDTNLASSKTFFNKFEEVGWEKWNEIGGELGNIILQKDKLRSDLNSIYIFHTDTITHDNGKVEYKVKTLGNIVDRYITIPSKFTNVFHAMKEHDPISNKSIRYFYNNDLDGSPAKSSPGMFDKNRTINDVGYILKKIEEYEK